MQEVQFQSLNAGKIRLLGFPQFSDGTPLPSRFGHKQLVLLARLLLESRPLTRESLIAFLWPESDEVRARGSLRQALYVIRDVVSDTALTATRQSIMLGQVPGLDIITFMEAIKRAQWREAALLYRGPLLEGVALKDATDAELWLELERRRFARLFETAALAVLREPRSVHDTQRNHERLTVARRLRDAAPRAARLWRQLLDELAHNGAVDDWRVERAALHARVDTGQIDDIPDAEALLALDAPMSAQIAF